MPDIPSIHWGALSPILVLFGAALLAITFSSLIQSPKKDLIGQAFGLVGGLGSLLACCILWIKVEDDGPILMLAETVRVDHMGLFIIGIIASAIFLCSLSLSSKKSSNEIFVLLILSGAGGAIMATSNDFIILFMGLEVLSLAAYILAASHSRKAKSQESGMKYFVIGAFASGFFLYGIALIYGATGSLKFPEIAEKLTRAGFDEGLLLGGIALLLVGLLFKVSAVPFHAWIPDVYEGAPSPIVAFMASAIKVAGFAALIRVLGGALIERAADWQPMIYTIAIASMAVGTFVAIVQTNVKRILAYSSIAHAGYILIGIQTGTQDGFASSLWYLAAYAILALGSFIIVAQMDSSHIDSFKGLATRQPLLAVTFAILLLAQAGVPPTSGFYAKFSVISAVVEERSYPLAIVAMVIAVAAAFIYLRLLVAMFFTDTQDTNVPKVPIPTKGVIFISVLFTIAMGVYPGPLLDLAQAGALSLV